MEEAIKALGINVPSIVAQVINFGILFLLLYMVAYRPIISMVDERSKKIKDSVDQAEYIKEQVARTEEEAEKRIAAATKEGQDMVARAVKTGEEVRQKAGVDAKVEAEVLIQRARIEIQRERDEAVDDVRKAFADLTVQAAEKVIDRSLDKEAHREIIEKVLEESTTFKKK